MKLQEVIDNTIVFLGKALNGNGGFADDELQVMQFCVNFALSEIAQEYLPLTAECEVCATGGKFYFENMPKRVSRIVSVRDKEGNEVRFKTRTLYCETGKDGDYTVEYRYLPETVTADGDCEVDPSVCSKTVALAACAEYCMINGMYEQSEGFAERFRQDMRALTRPVRTVGIKARRWY